MNRHMRTRRRAGIGSLRIEQLESRQLLASNVISGFVFNDANHDGLIGPGETVLAGSTIELVNSKGVVIGTTTVGADGSYSFTVDQSVSTNPATQTQTITVPETSSPFTLNETVPQFDPSLGTLTSVDVTSAVKANDHVQIENTDTAAHTLTDIVNVAVSASGPGLGLSGLVVGTTDRVTFDATAFDGKLDFAGTSGQDFGVRTQTATASRTITDPAALGSYAGVGTIPFTVVSTSLANATGGGNVVQSTTTTASAAITVVYHYVPSNMIQPGNYTIVQTKEPQGFINGLNSSNGTVLTGSPGSNTIPVTVTSGTTTYPNNDFGENQFPVPAPSPGSLAGSVFFDTNNNGVRDSSEFGIANVIVTLTGTTTAGQGVTRVATTDDFGNYSFTTLSPGTYTLTETPPTAFIKGKDHLGTLGGVKTTGQFSSIVVTPLAAGLSYDFGELARSGCKLLGLTQFHIRPGHKLLASRIGPEIRFYVPSLVPLITSEGAVAQPLRTHAASPAPALPRNALRASHRLHG